MNNTRPQKAMILAAGLGTRLHPITHEVPKPLVEVLNVPNILHSLFLIKQCGIRDVILNLYHLPEKIESFLQDGKRLGMRIEYSREKNLLGTGGGLKKAEKFFEGESFVLANCDFVSNVNLVPLIDKHLKHDALGTMVLYQNNELQPLYSKVGVDENGHLCSLPRVEVKKPSKTGIFTGIHILSSEAFRYLREEPSGINEVLYPTVMQESPTKIFGEFMTGFWRDTGDLPALLDTSVGLLKELSHGCPALREFMEHFGGYEEVHKDVWMPRDAKFPTGVEIHGPVIIGENARFGKSVKLGPYVVLGDDAVVGDKAKISKFVGLGRPQISSEEVSEGVIQFHQSKLPAQRAK